MKKKQMIKNNFAIAKLVIFISFLIVFTACQPNKSRQYQIADKNYKESIEKGRELLREFMITNFTPGMSVSVSYNNQIVWSEGFGLASKELKVPASPLTKYRIGNTSQMYTVFTLAKLQEEGLLDLNDSFYDYIPDYPRKKWDFSPLLLGVNAAGFERSKKSELFNPNKLRTLKDYIAFHESDTLAYQPATYYQKSDYSIALLGILAEEVTGTSFQKLVNQTILDTLGLKETMLDNPYLIIENRSEYYHTDYVSRQINAPSVDFRYISPAHGFISTANDLNKAGQAVIKPGFFSQESLDLFFTPYLLEGGYEAKRGFGWWVSLDYYNRKAYTQYGSTIGGSSILIVYPDQKLVVSACTNIEDEKGELPAKMIADFFLEQIDPQEKTN